jgi:hypothetical protein
LAIDALFGLFTKTIIMKIVSIKRTTKTENRFSPRMGRLVTKVTYIKRRFLGIPVQTLHRYRRTYYGEVKELEDCNLFI